MNTQDLIKQLENMDIPEDGFPTHQYHLRRVLLNSSYYTKKGGNMMIFLKRFSFVGVTLVVILLLLVGMNFINKPQLPSRTVYAKEIVTSAQEEVKAKAGAVFVNPDGTIVWKKPDKNGNIRDEQGNIMEVPSTATGYSFTKDGLLSSLKEAEQAKDLTYLGDKVKDGKRFKVLRFTDNKGNTTVLGVDKDNLPVVRFSYNKDGTSGGGVMFGQGQIMDGNQPSKGEGFGYGKVDPNAPRPDFEQTIEDWTTNLERPKDY